MHVNIHANPRFAKAGRHHQIGGFTAHPRQLQ